MCRLPRFVLGMALLSAAVAVGAAGGGSPGAPRQGQVISDGDLGFRVDGVGKDRVYGTFVVRVDGKWLEAQPPPPLAVVPALP